ncbi:MAG: hypothetical protein JWL81_19 [Verrucomicrobiales bacterium]|nr:hypothetical protein [Verrucomicrobiales bacterium]
MVFPVSPVKKVLVPWLVPWLVGGMVLPAAPPVFLRHPQPSAVPFAHTAVLSAETAFDPSLRWEWRKNGVVIPGADSAVLLIHNAMEPDTAEYHAVALTDSGLRWSDPAAIIVLPEETAPGRVDPAFTDAGLDGPVTALAAWGNGSVIAAGEFFNARGPATVPRLIRIRPDGFPDLDFRAGRPGPGGPVHGLAVAGGAFYVAGAFSVFDGAAASCLVRIRVDGTRDVLFQPDLPPGVEDVRVLAPLPDGRIYVGGRSRQGGVVSDWLVRLTADGARDNTFVSPPFLNGRVRALALRPDGKMWVAGNFFRPTGSTTHFNRVVLLTSSGTVEPTFKPPAGANSGANLEIRCLQSLPDGSCVVGGYFSRFNNMIRYGLAKVRADGSLDDVFNPPVLDDGVLALALDGADRLYAGGDFSLAGTVPVRSVARLDVVSGSPDMAWRPPMCNGPVASLLPTPAGLVAGGSFSSPHQAAVRLMVEPGPGGPGGAVAGLPLTWTARLFQRSQSLAASNGPVTLPDQGAVTFPLVVSNAELVSGIRLWLDLRHPDVQNLKLELLPPSGLGPALLLTDGTALRHGANFFRTCFSMQSPRSFSQAAAPYTDTLRPDADLSVLHGLSAPGTWNLRITDQRADARQAVLLSATLEIIHAAAEPNFAAWLGNRPAAAGDFASFSFAGVPGQSPNVSLLAPPFRLSHQAWPSDGDDAFQYWTSTDLVQWQAVNPLSRFSSHTPGGTRVSVVLPPGSAARRFWRVEAKRRP